MVNRFVNLMSVYRWVLIDKSQQTSKFTGLISCSETLRDAIRCSEFVLSFAQLILSAQQQT